MPKTKKKVKVLLSDKTAVKKEQIEEKFKTIKHLIASATGYYIQIMPSTAIAGITEWKKVNYDSANILLVYEEKEKKWHIYGKDNSGKFLENKKLSPTSGLGKKLKGKNISQAREVLKNTTSEAALLVLFKAKNHLDENDKIGGLLQKYIKECLNKYLSNPLDDMGDKTRAAELYRAFHLSSPQNTQSDITRNYSIARDYFALIKKSDNKRYKISSIIKCLCCKYVLKPRQINAIKADEALKQAAINEIYTKKLKLSGLPNFEKNKLSLDYISRETLREITENQTLDILEPCEGGDPIELKPEIKKNNRILL